MSLIRTALLFFESLAIRIKLADQAGLAAGIATIRLVHPYEEPAIDAYLLINI